MKCPYVSVFRVAKPTNECFNLNYIQTPTLKKMTAKPFFKLTSFSACALMASLGAITPSVAQAQGDSQSQSEVEQVKSAGVSVEVPEGSAPVKYTVDGEEFEVAPGSSLQLPANASSIVLPAGVTIKATKTSQSGKVTEAEFLVVNDFTLSSLTADSVRRSLKRNPAGIRPLDFFSVLPNGEILRNPRMLGSIQELVFFAQAIQWNAANVNGVVGVSGTDGRGTPRRGKGN